MKKFFGLAIFLLLMIITIIPISADNVTLQSSSFFQDDISQDTTTSSDGDPRYVGEVAAPEFVTGVDWLNVDAPLTIAGLEGKIILLDFWTYGCINCIHMIPILHDLEERFAEELVVIGVHSAKFDNEGETDNLSQIIQRYEIEHPVINDDDFLVWRTYGATAWPTFLVIDPRGYVVASQAGEVPYEAFEQYIAAMIEYYDENPEFGIIDRTPLELALEGAGDPGTPLAFPGKVLADSERNLLFISDTNHHRIVIANLDTYEVLDIIGTGQRGFNDGSFGDVTFNQPQGIELVGDTLYVADVNNHAIRAIDLDSQTVSTVVGTGTMERRITPFDVVVDFPTAVNIRSPWDVALGDDNILYIAMAGAHQIWQLDLESNQLRPSVGNGLEAQISSTLADSQLAQPSGLHWHDGFLYFADSESSTIRVADIGNNSVSVVSGTTENNLFDYGDIDGGIGSSLLQHALGVTANEDGSLIYIADTYNSKIKVFDTATGETSTLLGLSGNGGYRDGDVSVAQFDEPGGLDYADGRLYVADTNNHVIRVIDLETNTVSTVQFPNPEVLVINREEPTILGGNASEGVVITLDEQTVAAGDVEIALNFTLPDGYKINELTDSTVDIAPDRLLDLPNDDTRLVITEETTIIPMTVSEGEASLELTVALFYCEEDSYCLIDDVVINVPLVISSDAGNAVININREINLPEFLDSSD